MVRGWNQTAKSACEDGLPGQVPLFASGTIRQLVYAGLITTRGAAARLKYRMTANPLNVIRARWPNAKPQPATVSRPTRSRIRPASGGPTKPPAYRSEVPHDSKPTQRNQG